MSFLCSILLVTVGHNKRRAQLYAEDLCYWNDDYISKTDDLQSTFLIMCSFIIRHFDSLIIILLQLVSCIIFVIYY